MTSGEEQVSADLDLRPPPDLGLDLKYFLQEPAAMQGEGNPSQGPQVDDYEDWIEWRGCRVDMPNWWWELVGIPGITNFWELIQKIPPLSSPR